MYKCEKCKDTKKMMIISGNIRIRKQCVCVARDKKLKRELHQLAVRLKNDEVVDLFEKAMDPNHESYGTNEKEALKEKPWW